jgi:hypothetical protein
MPARPLLERDPAKLEESLDAAFLFVVTYEHLRARGGITAEQIYNLPVPHFR